MNSAVLLMADKDEEKRAGRPFRELPEKVANVRLYETVASKLNDIHRWRKKRLGRSGYNIADMYEEVFRTSVDEVWDRELALKQGQVVEEPNQPPVTPAVPHLVPITPGGFKLPFVGTVAAGTPVEIFEQPDEWFDFAEQFGAEGRYVFEVRGNSMADEGIRTGDYVIVRRYPEAKLGEDVVAVIDGELTLKRLLARRKAETILVSCDGKQTQYRLDDGRGDHIIGVLLGSVRKQKKR